MTIVQNEEQMLTAMKNKDSEIQILGGYADKIKPAIEKAYSAKTFSKKLIASPVTGPLPILETFKDQKYINNSYISNVDAATGIVTVNLDSSDELYNDVINNMIGESINSKASMMKIFQTYKSSKEEFESIKQALKQAKTSGYGIIYPSLKDMKLQKPEIIKQGNRYGVKLKAGASSIHLIKVDVESTFEPIIGSELQSKELINYLMKDSETDPSNIWKSEIFGRSLNEMVEEGMKAKLSIMNDNTKYKLGQTLTKIVNKGSSNLIAIVL